MLTSTDITKNDSIVVIKKMWVEAACILFTFLISYMLYPSIIFQKSIDIFPDRSDWSIFVLNISFGLSDFMGRTFAKLIQSYSRNFLIVLATVRIIFVATSFLIALSN